METHAGRLFLAAPLDAAVREALDAHLSTALPEPLPGRRVPAQNWHLTLRFLGDTPTPTSEALVRELRQAPLGPRFAVRLGGWGAFPRESRATVLWLGLDGGEAELARLAGAVAAATERAGFPREKRPFSAHLTLSRLNAPQDVRPLLAGLPPFAAEMPVEEVVLYRSELGKGPPRYQAVERFALGA